MKVFFKKVLIVFLLILLTQSITSLANSNKNLIEMPISNDKNNSKDVIEHLNYTNDRIVKIDSKTRKKEIVNINYDKILPILEKMKTEKNYSTNTINPQLNHPQLTNSLKNNSLFSLSPRSSNYVICLGNTNSPSQRPICKITSDGGSGTGFLIGDNYLLTAGHCVLTPEANVYGYLSAYAGYSNGNYAQEMGWNTVYYSENWVSYGGGSSFDWAIVELDGNYGSSLGYLYCTKYYNYEDMVNTNVSAWGCPGITMNGEYLCYSNGVVTSSNSWTFNSSCTVENGFSGGPTIMNDGTSCGINIQMYSSNNQTGTLKSIRFNDNLFNIILDLLYK